MSYDLLVKGGEVLDPGQGLRGVMDVAIQGDKIAAIEPSIPAAQAADVLDATGMLVTPGLIDLHTHLYWGVGPSWLDPDVEAPKGAVCTQADAGSADAGMFPGFRRFIIDSANSRVFTWLNIAPRSSRRWDTPVGPRNVLQRNRSATERTIEENRDVIIGLKSFCGWNVAGPMADPNLDYAREVADRRNVPIMVHISTGPPTIESVVSRLREGDVLSHSFTGHDQRIVDMYGKLKPAVKEARERGVLLDIGHGEGSFSFRVAELMLDQGQPPDIISTDLHGGCVNGPTYNLVTTLNKFLALGMSLEDVILRATTYPARVIRRLTGLGALQVGGIADVSLLRYEDGDFELVDCHGCVKRLEKGLVPELAVCKGQILR